jgi:multiple sugar transport system permease protein
VSHFGCFFYLLGWKKFPTQYYEAAKIDGARPFEKFRFITLPLLKRTILFVFVADTATNFVLMVPMIILTKGGPMQSTNVLGFRSL